MEAVFAFLLGFLLNPWAFLAVAAIAAFFTAEEFHFLATVLLLWMGYTLVTYFAIPWHYVIFAVPAYLLVGLGWSLIRYSIFLKKTLEEFSQRESPPSQYLVSAVSPKRQIGRIVYWVLLWPFSITHCLLGDFTAFIRYAVLNWFGNFFQTAFDRFNQAIPKEPKKENQ